MSERDEHVDDATEDMAQTVDWLRAAFRDARGAAAETESPIAAADLIDGNLSPAEAEVQAAWLLDAPEAALAVRVAAAMRAARAAEGLVEGDAVEQEVGATVVAMPERAAPDRRWVWAGLTAVAAALLATWFLRPPALDAVPDDAVRAAGDPPIVSALEDSTLPRDTFVLAWSGGPNAATYDLYITTPDLVQVYQALDLRGHAHRVPAEALVDIAAGNRLLWRVVAAGPRGRRAHSNAFEVVVE